MEPCTIVEVYRITKWDSLKVAVFRVEKHMRINIEDNQRRGKTIVERLFIIP